MYRQTPYLIRQPCRSPKKCRSCDRLQQVHYWLGKKGGKIIDGVHWIHNTYEQWLEQFPWLTKWRLRQVFYRLRETEILKFAQHDQRQYKRRGYYTIDYDKLNALQESMCDISTHQDVETQTIEVCNAHTSIEQENSFQEELLTENTHPPLPAAVIENLKGEEKIQQEQMMALTPQNEALATEAVADSATEAASQETKLELIKTAGIRLNVQLSALVQNFTLENVKNAIATTNKPNKTNKPKVKPSKDPQAGSPTASDKTGTPPNP